MESAWKKSLFNSLILASYCVLLLGGSWKFTKQLAFPTKQHDWLFPQQHCQQSTFVWCYLQWLIKKILVWVKCLFFLKDFLHIEGRWRQQSSVTMLPFIRLWFIYTRCCSRLHYEMKNKQPRELNNTASLSSFCSVHIVNLFHLACSDIKQNDMQMIN